MLYRDGRHGPGFCKLQITKWFHCCIGILGHHLVHDGTAWAFLDELSALVSEHPASFWLPPDAVFVPESP